MVPVDFVFLTSSTFDFGSLDLLGFSFDSLDVAGLAFWISLFLLVSSLPIPAFSVSVFSQVDEVLPGLLRKFPQHQNCQT